MKHLLTPALFLLACTPRPVPVEPVAPAAPVALSPLSVWSSTCASCHGEASAFKAAKRRSGPDVLTAIGAGTQAAPWHTFWFLGPKPQATIASWLTGEDASTRPLAARHVLLGQRALAQLPNTALTTTDQDAARQLYLKANCGACHGPEGRGNGPAADALRPRPGDWGDPKRAWKRGASAHAIHATMTTGIEGTSMASYLNLTVAQRWLLARYIAGELVHEDARVEVAPKRDLDRLVGHLRDQVRFAEPEQLHSPGAWARALEAKLPKLDGGSLYEQRCAGCHNSNGQGGPPKTFPPLVGTQWTDDPTQPDRHIEVLLAGLVGKVTVLGKPYNGVMAPFRHLDDRELAAIITYVNTSWGNKGAVVTPRQVAAKREALGLVSHPGHGIRPSSLEGLKLQAGATCQGCHGSKAADLSTYQSVSTPVFLGALLEGKGGHPTLGRAMHPSTLCGMVGVLQGRAGDARCVDLVLSTFAKEKP